MEGQGAARLVSHLPVVWPAPLPANRGGPPGFRRAGAEAALCPCGRAYCGLGWLLTHGLGLTLGMGVWSMLGTSNFKEICVVGGP